MMYQFSIITLLLVLMNGTLSIRSANQYFELIPISGTYKYGYALSNPSGQFHHEVRDASNITYGCYGFVDRMGINRITHYLADIRGYRLIRPNEPVQVFVSNSDGKPEIRQFSGNGCVPTEVIHIVPVTTDATTALPGMPSKPVISGNTPLNVSKPIIQVTTGTTQATKPSPTLATPPKPTMPSSPNNAIIGFIVTPKPSVGLNINAAVTAPTLGNVISESFSPILGTSGNVLGGLLSGSNLGAGPSSTAVTTTQKPASAIIPSKPAGLAMPNRNPSVATNINAAVTSPIQGNGGSFAPILGTTGNVLVGASNLGAGLIAGLG